MYFILVIKLSHLRIGDLLKFVASALLPFTVLALVAALDTVDASELVLWVYRLGCCLADCIGDSSVITFFASTTYYDWSRLLNAPETASFS